MKLLLRYGLRGFLLWTVVNIAIGLAWGIPAGLAILAAMPHH